MLTLTPVVCLSAAMVISKIFDTYLDPVLPGAGSGKDAKTAVKERLDADSNGNSIPEAPLASAASPSKSKKKAAVSADSYTAPLARTVSPASPALHGLDLRLIIVTFFTAILALFVLHCTWVTSSAYSSPSVVLASRAPDGSQNIIDDFREAYYWLRRNTAEDAKVMSWWDYGYQIAGFADRTTLVDNNTWNNTQYVGRLSKITSRIT